MLFEHLERLLLALYYRDFVEIRGAQFFNSECTISAGDTLRTGAGLSRADMLNIGGYLSAASARLMDAALAAWRSG